MSDRKTPDVLLYLLGEGQLDGCSYPNFPDNGERYKRRYWWRKALREAFENIAPTEPSITLRELKALVEEKTKIGAYSGIWNAALADLYEAAEKGRG